ncbi:MAG: CCA tRNA nucleotidyltransferase [Thermoplasmatales archaeon]|nr:MAG: CCA tRNA nucleotidyltransferase [Thermoplasmatales archaeon]
MIEGSKDIEKEVLKKITSSPRERKELEHVIRQLKKEVTKEIEKSKLKLSIELVGSTAKETYLKDSVDIDLFVLFPTIVPRKQLQETGLSIGRSILENQEECFAEHPYIRGTYKVFKAEIVPCYRIESASQKLSAVDRTPLHTKYVKEHLLESQKKEVRLLKQFLRGVGCYGAEAEVEGFSGYLCEILILKYSTFQNLIINAQKWRYGKKLFLDQKKSPRFDTPLVFIDPVDSQRNVSSALSEEKFNLFVKACKEYIKKSRITFFFPYEIKPWPINKIKKEIEKKEFIWVKIEKPPIIPENLYPQVRKAIRSIIDLCERYDFTILDSRFHINDTSVYILLLPRKRTISKTMLHMGPPVKLKKNAEEFIQRWKDNPRTTRKPFEKDKRLYVEIKREYTDIKNLLEEQVKNQSLGKHIDKIVQKDFTILERDDFLKDNLRAFWTEYLDKKMPWQR